MVVISRNYLLIEKSNISLWPYKVTKNMGSGCSLVGIAVASDTRDPRFEIQHQQNFIYQLYIQIEKTKIKKKRPGMARLKKVT